MTTAPGAGRAGTIAGIDGLRALSVLFVMALHASYGRLSGGFLGVDIFFVISGFLITHLLVEEQRISGRVSLRDFYLRRLFRIVPPLVATIILALLLWRGAAADRWPVAQAALLFYANFLPAERLGDLGHTWSLAIEEQFYLVWPLLFLAVFARAPRLLALLAALVVAGSVAMRFWLVAHWTDLDPLYSFTPARLDAIMLGCLLALGGSAARPGTATARWLAWAAMAAVLAALLFAQRPVMQAHPLAFLGFALVATALVAGVAALPQGDWLGRLLNSAPARYIGKRSYGLYLYHYPVFGALEQWRAPGDLANYALVTAAKIALSFALAELSWRALEQPMLRLKTRVAGRRTA